MIRTTLNWTVKNLKTMRDEKATLSFNHPIQRQSAQWDNEQQSLLLHSMLDNFPVPSVYIHKTESVEVDAKSKHSYSYSVLDGKQRMTTVFSYIDGEFALSDDTPDVTIEDTVYEIAGKYFDDLDEDVQQEILRFKFNIQAFEDVSDETIEEIFFRLNNSTPLTKPQKAKPLMGVSNSIFINEILASRFFKEKCNFTKLQLTQSADLCTLLQCMLLLDNKYRRYDFPNISDDEVMSYSKWINGNYPDECKCRLKKIVAFLDNLFFIKEKNLRKINIPIIFLVADEALKQSITGTNFRRWFEHFFNKCKEKYGQYCSSGSIKKEKTLGRISVMMESFNSYFQLQEDKSTGQSAEESAEAEIAGAEFPAALEDRTGDSFDTESSTGIPTGQEDNEDISANNDADAESTEQEDEQPADDESDNSGKDLSGNEPDDTEQEESDTEPDAANGDFSDEGPDSTAQADESDKGTDDTEQEEDSAEDMETSAENGFTGNVEDSAVQETDAEDSTEQNPGGYAIQDADESFSDDLQKGADDSNDSDTENTPDAEDADSEVSNTHTEPKESSSFFGSMARFWNKERVMV